MYTNKLTEKQHSAICGFINGLRKMNVEPYAYFDLSSYDEYSYERTETSFETAKYLCSSLKSFMNNVHDTRCN